MIKIIKIILIVFFVLIITLSLVKKDFLSKTLIKNNYILLNNSETNLNEVWVTGLNNESKENIIRAFQYEIGTPINNIKLNEILERINKLNWVNKAKVILLPHGLIEIFVQEYMPFAKYKDSEQLYIINIEGIKFLKIEKNDFPELFLLDGNDSLLGLKELQELRDFLNNINLRIKEVKRIDSRRWDLFLTSGFHIKLPSDNSLIVLKKFMNLEYDKLDYKNISFIDLRVPNRIILKNK